MTIFNDPEITKLREYEEGYIRGNCSNKINIQRSMNLYEEGYINGYQDSIKGITKNCESCRYSIIDNDNSKIFCSWIKYLVYRCGICEAYYE